MESVHLFQLASQHKQWLSVRQSTVAENVANIDTPVYSARDVAPFSSVFKQVATQGLSATHARHFTSQDQATETVEVKPTDSWDTTHSGNSVSVEQEMQKANEIMQGHALNTNLISTMHRMMMFSLRG